MNWTLGYTFFEKELWNSASTIKYLKHFLVVCHLCSVSQASVKPNNIAWNRHILKVLQHLLSLDGNPRIMWHEFSCVLEHKDPQSGLFCGILGLIHVTKNVSCGYFNYSLTAKKQKRTNLWLFTKLLFYWVYCTSCWNNF